MASKKSQQLINLLIVAFLLGGLYFGYINFFDGSSTVAPQQITHELPDGTVITTQRLISLVGELSAIRLDRSILDTEGFKKLRSFVVVVPPEPTGTDNPFSSPPF